VLTILRARADEIRRGVTALYIAMVPARATGSPRSAIAVEMLAKLLDEDGC
jgi:hypothetical protein